MLRKNRLFLVVTCLILIALGSGNTLAQGGELPAREIAAPDSPFVELVSQENERVALAMWSSREDRMAATALPLPEISLDEIKSLDAIKLLDEGQELTGTPGFVAGAYPDPRADTVAQREFRGEWRIMEDELRAFAQEDRELGPFEAMGTRNTYTSYRGNAYAEMWRTYPYRAVGKLYIDGGGTCSASVIGPNIIVTAAHCVYNRGTRRWYRGWTFVPADRGGAAPYGTFRWRNARILTGWRNTGGARYDVALIRLWPNRAGRSVSYYTGALGRSWNYGSTVNLHAIGYPGNLESGRYTYICTAETFSGGTNVLRMGCNMQHGSSGGPWIRRFAPYRWGNYNYVNSVVHGGVPGSGTFRGVRFSNENIVPLCRTSWGWGCSN